MITEIFMMTMMIITITRPRPHRIHLKEMEAAKIRVKMDKKERNDPLVLQQKAKQKQR